MGKGKHHIAFFLLSLDGGGLERVVLNLAKSFVNDDHLVDIVVAYNVGAFKNQIPQGVNLVDLQASRVIACLPALWRYLRECRPEALLATGNFTNLIAIWAVKLGLAKTKVFASEHIMYSFFLKEQKNLRDKLLPILMRFTYRLADGIIAVSAGLADELAVNLKIPRNKISVINNPIVDGELLEKSRQAIDHPWFEPGEPPVIVAVGRLVEAKDFPTLIKAFALVRETTPAKLLIMGEGEKRQELELLVKNLNLANDVSLPGFVENPYAYMRRASLFVLSSKWESFGNVIVEAMAVGTPVVATDCPSGPREILDNGIYGGLVTVGNIITLAECIITALGQHNDRSFMTRAQEYTVTLIANKYLDYICSD